MEKLAQLNKSYQLQNSKLKFYLHLVSRGTGHVTICKGHVKEKVKTSQRN